ncbi:AzlC family ABC transporter permease [Thauera aminoaromatica]|jgi:4-azaleucine resistance transporter AzlC|uniref:AzlC family protein n=2 Tax=Thauera aminoaromatica TaxID=164330 RepID=C4K9D7_THASP|nr:AzlC family ABC transporter permease [Thauera aminoaromatica]MBL8462714.1 AzlC family ABC transporter permease [Thauera sp.]HMX10916.1 AzlC family ABC transporter permease [Burkholderiaceae bacterium]HNW64469.1 AzlC family ABC transporter permease [Piscinibacter sp.]ACR02648.1 AzlC family protein [Thauera aminoaromatica]ENO81877.1 AzlC family protein [Thauera aminoaromatica S2]
MAHTGTSARREFLAGCRDEAPLLLGVAPFGMIYGIAALAAGVPAWLAQLASAIVFAGAAQLVIVQMLAAGAGFIPIALTSGLLNLRHVLYSASMAEYVRHLPRRWRLLLAYVLTDEAYAVAVLRYQQRHAAAADHAEHTNATADLRHWYFLGAGFTLWAGWQLSTAAGLLFGTTIPPEWELDFAVPLTFIALLTLLLRERAGQAAALVAGLGALAFAALPYKLGLVAAIVLGLAAGAWTVRRLEQAR